MKFWLLATLSARALLRMRRISVAPSVANIEAGRTLPRRCVSTSPDPLICRAVCGHIPAFTGRVHLSCRPTSVSSIFHAAASMLALRLSARKPQPVARKNCLLAAGADIRHSGPLNNSRAGAHQPAHSPTSKTTESVDRTPRPGSRHQSPCLLMMASPSASVQHISLRRGIPCGDKVESIPGNTGLHVQYR